MQILFALGSNGSGQLGIGHKEDVSVPKQVLLPSDLPDSTTITKVVAGGNHTILLTSDHTLLWSGDASTGACGNSIPTPQDPSSQLPPQFRPVHGLPEGFQVGLAAATWEATIITQLDPSTNTNTAVYTFGAGLKGELGQGSFIFRTPTPSRIPDFPPEGTHIVHLAASMNHVVAVLSNGEAWGWGNGRKGQLGPQGTEAGVVYSPQKIQGIDFSVAGAVCGREFTCLFSKPESGKFVVLGSEKSEAVSKAPALDSATFRNWRQVGAGWRSVFVLGDDGTVFPWGRDDHGQISQTEHLKGDGKLKQIAVGSEHVLALSEKGDVVAWGWGEHGNCGPIDQEAEKQKKGQKNIVASSKFIPPGAKITLIAAGCATSWVGIDMPTAAE